MQRGEEGDSLSWASLECMAQAWGGGYIRIPPSKALRAALAAILPTMDPTNKSAPQCYSLGLDLRACDQQVALQDRPGQPLVRKRARLL